jgi:hypothetical protein
MLHRPLDRFRPKSRVGVTKDKSARNLAREDLERVLHVRIPIFRYHAPGHQCRLIRMHLYINELTKLPPQ